MLYEVIAWILVLGFAFVCVAVIIGFVLLIILGALTMFGEGARRQYQYIADTEPEETTEESEFDGLLGIDGETDEELEESVLFPPEFDLGEDEN